MKPTNNSKFKYVLFVSSALMLSMPALAAQTIDPQDVMNKINQLEKQIETMSRAVYGDEKAVGQKAHSEETTAAGLSTMDERLNRLEEQNKEITNNFEKVNHDIAQVQEELNKLKMDVDQRFQQSSAIPTPATPSPATSNNGQSLQSGEYLQAPNSSNQASSSDAGEGKAAAGEGGSLYDQGFAAVKASDYNKAETSFKSFIDQNPDSTLVPNALYWLGETYYVRSDFKNAAKSFAKGFQKYPSSPKANDSLLKLSLSLAALGKNEDACLALSQLKKQVKTAEGPIVKKADEQIKKLNCKQ